MGIRIKNYGDDAECKTIIELQKLLYEKYRGKSITINANGINHFVDVDANGDVSDSYRGNAISLDTFKSPL